LDNVIANALVSINAVKGIYIGNSEAHKLTGFENNDEISQNGFISNNAGGILGGISNGEDILIKVYFKPTPSIFKQQKTIDIYNNNVNLNLEGRHDPCIAPRGSIVAEAMASLVIADMLLLNLGRNIKDICKIYKK